MASTATGSGSARLALLALERPPTLQAAVLCFAVFSALGHVVSNSEPAAVSSKSLFPLVQQSLKTYVRDNYTK